MQKRGEKRGDNPGLVTGRGKNFLFFLAAGAEEMTFYRVRTKSCFRGLFLQKGKDSSFFAGININTQFLFLFLFLGLRKSENFPRRRPMSAGDIQLKEKRAAEVASALAQQR